MAVAVMGFDPAIQKIFDDMKAFMGTSYNNCTAACIQDSSATTYTITYSDPQSNNYQQSERIMGNVVSIKPPNASLGPGATQQFTASATDTAGNPITGATFNWSLQRGALGSVSATGLYTAPATITYASSDIVTATISTSFSSASVSVALHT